MKPIKLISVFFIFVMSQQNVVFAQGNMTSLRISAEQEVVESDIKYHAGNLTARADILEYIGLLEFLHRIEDAYTVINTQLKSGGIESSAVNLEKAGYYLLRLKRDSEALPFMRQVALLGSARASYPAPNRRPVTQALCFGHTSLTGNMCRILYPARAGRTAQALPIQRKNQK